MSSTFYAYDPVTLHKVHQFTSKTHGGAARKAVQRGMKKVYIRKTGDKKVKVYQGSKRRGSTTKIFKFDVDQLPCKKSYREKKKQQLLAKHTEEELVQMGLARFVTYRNNTIKVRYEQSFTNGEDVKLINGPHHRTLKG